MEIDYGNDGSIKINQNRYVQQLMACRIVLPSPLQWTRRSNSPRRPVKTLKHPKERDEIANNQIIDYDSSAKVVGTLLLSSFKGGRKVKGMKSEFIALPKRGEGLISKRRASSTSMWEHERADGVNYLAHGGHLSYKWNHAPVPSVPFRRTTVY